MSRPVLITGCSSGIGLATTRYLAERGVPVYATVRSNDDLQRLNVIEGVEAFVCDVTRDDHVRALRAAIDERGGGLWGLVHNAGIGYIGHLTTTPLDVLRTIFEVNVFGVHRVTNALVDLITLSVGRIVTMSSLSGTLASEHMGPYSMSKHALEAYTDALAAQLAPSGVHVAAVVPGNFASSIVANAVKTFGAPPEASPEIAALFEPGADLSRSSFAAPDLVAAACHAALFDDDPLERYLVVPEEDEARRTLEQAAREWIRLDVSTEHGWGGERLLAFVAEVQAEVQEEA